MWKTLEITFALYPVPTTPNFVLLSPVCCRASGTDSAFFFQVIYFCFVFVDMFSLNCNRHTEKGTDHQCTSEWVLPTCAYPCHHYPDQELAGTWPASRHPPSHMSPSPAPPLPPQLNTTLSPKVTHSLCLSGGFMSVKSSHMYYSVSGVFKSTICWWDSSVLQSVHLFSLLYYIFIVSTHQFVYPFCYWAFGVFLLWGYYRFLYMSSDTCMYVLLFSIYLWAEWLA